MTELMQIQPFIQAYVQAISSILETEVTVVDSSLARVGGTGTYQLETGKRVPHDSFFRDVLESGKPGIIEDVRSSFACHSCARRESCKELANLAFPIFKGGRAVGIIAIIAFQESQREKLLRDRQKLEEFLKYMSFLMESKLVTQEQNLCLERQLSGVAGEENRRHSFENFIGASPEVQRLLDQARRVADSDSTIMLRGESGTGKEILAKAIHAASSRNKKLLVSVNCGAIPEALVESELFGYEEGAFTGAKKHGQMGKFELAQGSTIFLDEIGDMPLAVQAKLLRALQEKKIERLGGKHPVPVEFRVICATNRNLEAMVESGEFRRDLYYRLNVIPLEIPPLRLRRGDVPLLAEHFLEHYTKKLARPPLRLDPDVERALEAYSWPGNVRELKNLIEYLCNMTEGDRVALCDLPPRLVPHAGQGDRVRPLAKELEEYEGRLLTRLAKGRATLAQKEELARQLGISKATLYRKLGKYGLL